MGSQNQAIKELGQRLRAYRIGAGMTPDEIAKQTGISRAAIYRYESGQPIRVDALGKIADLLDVSLTSLLGVGSEYISSALSFFERMRQIEEEADHISVLFGPISYLLTTDEFDANLPSVLMESVPDSVSTQSDITKQNARIADVLLARKEAFKRRKPNIVSLVSAGELEQFLSSGFVGRHNLDDALVKRRREVARHEVENIIRLLTDQPIGVQIGVVVDSLPVTSFQIFRQSQNAQVAVSPFRLGAYANVRIGVATITSAQEPVHLHQEVTERLWKRSLKSWEAAEYLRKLIS